MLDILLRRHLDTPALLTDPSYCGTLAAARALGRCGLPVWVAGERGAHTNQSRYVGRHWRSDVSGHPTKQLRLLTEIGKSHPGTVLYPTSDDLAWLESVHADELRPLFKMYAPAADAIENVLDKRRLFEACYRVGIASPPTYFVESLAEIESIASRAKFPVLLKQRTQLWSTTKSKGAIVNGPEQLLEAYRDFGDRNRHAEEVYRRLPFASWPLIQEFLPDAHKGSYLISGFINRDHSHIVALAAVKVLQYPRTLGVALCMEDAPLDADLLRRIQELCHQTGVFGVFQIEFLVDGPRKLLIDFNPRYYHYMAFDIHRGLALPWLVQLGACGDEAALIQAMCQINSALQPHHEATFCYRARLTELLWAQRIAGSLSAMEFRRWRQWCRQHRGHMVDAVADADDRRPQIADVFARWREHLRRPRAFVRKVALDKTG